MDNQKTVQWVVTALIRLVMGWLVVKLGLTAAESANLSEGLISGITALVIAGISIYTSVKSRKVLLATPPPTGSATK